MIDYNKIVLSGEYTAKVTIPSMDYPLFYEVEASLPSLAIQKVLDQLADRFEFDIVLTAEIDIFSAPLKTYYLVITVGVDNIPEHHWFKTLGGAEACQEYHLDDYVVKIETIKTDGSLAINLFSDGEYI